MPSEKRLGVGRGGRRPASYRDSREVRAPRHQEDTRGTMRKHFVAMLGEFVGTVLFLWFAFAGTQFANTTYDAADSDRILYVALSFGFSLMVNAWIFYRISGGLFNPAVTLGLCLTGNLPWVRGLLLFPSQLLGGIVAAALVSAMFPGPSPVGTTLTLETSVVQGLFIEMFLTSLLVLTILMLAAEKSRITPLAPIGIGMCLFIAELSGAPYTGGSLNPVRSFGPDAVQRTFATHHWIYWLGPALGACLAAAYYKLSKFLNYEEANPGQDATSSHERDLEQGKASSRSGSRHG